MKEEGGREELAWLLKRDGTSDQTIAFGGFPYNQNSYRREVGFKLSY